MKTLAVAVSRKVQCRRGFTRFARVAMHGRALFRPLKLMVKDLCCPAMERGQAFPASHERTPPAQWEISVEQIHLRMPGTWPHCERKEEKT
jgi:hypothetical protein